MIRTGTRVVRPVLGILRNSLSSLVSTEKSIFPNALPNLKFGPSNRHANSGMTATVFGAYGASGRYITNELGMIILIYIFPSCEIVDLLY